MNRLRVVCLLVGLVMLVGCGSDPKTNPTGTWTATLTQTVDQNSVTVLAFNDSLATNPNQSSDPNTTLAVVTASNLKITTNNGCLSANPEQTAAFTSDPTSNTFVLLIHSTGSGAAEENVLTMQGTLNNKTITGTWTLAPVDTTITEPSCAGAGDFKMILVGGSSFIKTLG